jgi:uncharacterized membrane protein
MPSHHDRPIPSRVSIKQHPLHPALVSFPISFLVTTLLTDAVFWWRHDEFWAQLSFLLLAAGFVMGVLAALVGIADFAQIRQARQQIAGWSHLISGVMALSLAGANVLLRIGDPAGAVLPWGIFLSAVMVVLVSVTGWLGGTLTFRYGIGTYSDDSDSQVDDASNVGDDAADPR